MKVNPVVLSLGPGNNSSDLRTYLTSVARKHIDLNFKLPLLEPQLDRYLDREKTLGQQEAEEAAGEVGEGPKKLGSLVGVLSKELEQPFHQCFEIFENV